MTTRQIISTTINMSQAAFVNSDNTTRSNVKPILFAGNESLFTCQLLASNGTNQALGATTEFYATLDTVYGPGSADLVTVPNELFNVAADWDSIDLATGKFCFPLTTATQGIIDALGSQAQASVHIEIWFRLPGGAWSIMLHESLNIRNVTADFNPVATEGITYLTTNDLDNTLLQSDEGYTVTAPPADVKAYNPATASAGNTADCLATLIATLKTRGIV